MVLRGRRINGKHKAIFAGVLGTAATGYFAYDAAEYVATQVRTVPLHTQWIDMHTEWTARTLPEVMGTIAANAELASRERAELKFDVNRQFDETATANKEWRDEIRRTNDAMLETLRDIRQELRRP